MYKFLLYRCRALCKLPFIHFLYQKNLKLKVLYRSTMPVNLFFSFLMHPHFYCSKFSNSFSIHFQIDDALFTATGQVLNYWKAFKDITLVMQMVTQSANQLLPLGALTNGPLRAGKLGGHVTLELPRLDLGQLITILIIC